MFEARSEARDQCQIEARIVTGGRIIPCLVEDLSERGAKLAIGEEIALPSAFELELPVFDGVRDRRDVERRWQVGRRCGVRFRAVATDTVER